MTHKDLKVYSVSMDLIEEVYQVTNSYPKHEMYGLSNQMRRASVSIISNIAEGASRNSTKEYIRFLYISLASLSELETQFEISTRLNYCKAQNSYEQKVIQIRMMLLSLIKSLSKKLTKK